MNFPGAGSARGVDNREVIHREVTRRIHCPRVDAPADGPSANTVVHLKVPWRWYLRTNPS